jgi:hypothetical protein
MSYQDCQNAFHTDGSLRDIYVQDVTIEDWEKFLTFVRNGGFSLRYFRDQELGLIPRSAAHILKDRSCAHNLVIDLGGVEVCCHFFIEDEIELDIDPREVASSDTKDRVLDFMRQLGANLDRDVILTEENSPEHVWFRYSSKSDVITCEQTV